MPPGWRTAGSLLSLLFVLAIFLRPLLSNPFVLALLERGVTDWQTTVLVLLASVPLALILAAKLTARVRDHDPASEPTGQRRRATTAKDESTADLPFEPEPPAASLEDHFAHLEVALDEADTDPVAMEALRAADDDRLPARCPGEHCDAAWTERGVLGLGTGRYEVLAAEEAVICLECEREFSLPALRE